MLATHLQKDSGLGVDTQAPPFLHGLGEQDTRPATEPQHNITDHPTNTWTTSSLLYVKWSRMYVKDHTTAILVRVRRDMYTTSAGADNTFKRNQVARIFIR